MKRTGFTLIEIAIGIFIITLLLGSLLVPLTTQVKERKVATTQATLNEIQTAILGFAALYGRMPCPANTVSSGVEVCGAVTDGYVPVMTLGLTASTTNSLIVDAWNNPIRYAVHASYITTAGVKAALATPTPPGLKVCASNVGITAIDCGPVPGNTLTSIAPSVTYSTGINGPTAVSVDEAANLNLDPVFIFRQRVDKGATAGEFDDMVVWTSPYVVFLKMVNAGTLP